MVFCFQCTGCFSGVTSVLVSLLAQKAEIVYQADATDEREIQNHIKDLGFGAEILESSAGENAVEIQVGLIIWYTQQELT